MTPIEQVPTFVITGWLEMIVTFSSKYLLKKIVLVEKSLLVNQNQEKINKYPIWLVFMNLKYSLVLVALVALITIDAIVGQGEVVVAQNQTTTTHRSITNFTKLIEDEYTPDVLKEGKREHLVKLIHEVPTTLILENVVSEMGSLSEVIDIAIQNGYKLDAVTVFTEEEPSDIADYIQLNPVYTVFMSKD